MHAAPLIALLTRNLLRPADEIMSCLEQVIHQSGVDQACR